MRLTGRLYFDFACPYVNRLSRLLSAAQEGGADLDLDWRPFSLEQVNASDDSLRLWEEPERSRYGGIHALASHEWVRATHPYALEAYRRALLFVRHDEEGDLADWGSYVSAAGVVGLDGEELVAAVRDEGQGYEEVGRSYQEARGQGVFGVPTFLEERGTPLFIKLRPASLDGDPRDYVDLIARAARDDGVWELKKPS